MISYTLRCGRDHTFEAWFRDSATYEKQACAGEVVCPICGDTSIEKAPMAPHVACRQVRDRDRDRWPADDVAMLRQALLRLREHIEKNCDYVGDRFAEEARRIHYGEAERRDIYGHATEEEARALEEEDIQFSRLPFLPRTDS